MHTPIVFLDQQLNNAQEARSSGPEGSGFDGTEFHPVTPTTHDRGADTMTESHGYTYDVEPDADRVTVYRPNGNKAWFYDGRQLRNGGYDTLGDYAKFLDCVGYKRRDSIPFPSGASVITAGDKIVKRIPADINAAMIARDGQAQPKAPVLIPEPTALPCPAGFSAFRSPDMGSSSHLVEWVHGTAHR